MPGDTSDDVLRKARAKLTEMVENARAKANVANADARVANATFCALSDALQALGEPPK